MWVPNFLKSRTQRVFLLGLQATFILSFTRFHAKLTGGGNGGEGSSSRFRRIVKKLHTLTFKVYKST